MEEGGKGTHDDPVIGKNSSLGPCSDGTSETMSPRNDGDKSPGALAKGKHSDSEGGTKRSVARP